MNIYFLFFFIRFNNYFIYFFNLFLSLESNYEIPKYVSISCSSNEYVYLDLSDYRKGDSIYLVATFYSDSLSDYNYLSYIYCFEYCSHD